MTNKKNARILFNAGEFIGKRSQGTASDVLAGA